MPGLPIALRAARHGRTAFVEREQLGGTCLNRGCIPTKTMIASANVAQQIRRAGEFGCTPTAGGSTWPRSSTARTASSSRSATVATAPSKKNGDLDLIEGHGRFTGAHRLQVDGHTIEADRVFLNTGTRDLIPPIDGLDPVPYLTSRTSLDPREMPEHLVGAEFAQMFRRYGARVTLVQRAGRLVPAEDPAIAEVIAETFTDAGIDLLRSTPCVAVDSEAVAIRVACQGAETTELTGSHLLIATGRTPNTDDLGGEHLELDLDDRGYVPVDGRLQTAADGIWSLG